MCPPAHMYVYMCLKCVLHLVVPLGDHLLSPTLSLQSPDSHSSPTILVLLSFHKPQDQLPYPERYTIIRFCVLKYFRQAQKCRIIFSENLTQQKIRKRGIWPTTSLSFVVFTCCCPQLFLYMLASKDISTSFMNFVHEI